MRIAVCGAHAVGKTTLVNALADAVRGHIVVEEPYHALAAAGHVFEDPPGIDDFEDQLAFSIESVHGANPNVIFDRCPADLLAYLAETAASDVMTSYWADAERALALVDAVIYVPIERPDRIQLGSFEYPKLRRRVDRRLRQMLYEYEIVPASRVREVSGTVSERVQSVISML